MVEHEMHAAAAAAEKNELAMLALMGSGSEKAAPKKFDGVAYAKALPGVTEPLGFWDPLGFCEDEKLTEGKLKFYRECELKHGRLGPAWRALLRFRFQSRSVWRSGASHSSASFLMHRGDTFCLVQ